MAYKTVRRNGRDVLIDTRTGKEVKPGQRLMNELRWAGQGINDNLTYSDKVDARTGRRLTPAEVRKAEKPSKPAAKPSSKPAAKPATKPAAKNQLTDAEFDKKYGTNDPKNNLARNEAGKPRPAVPRPAGTQPSRPAASRPAAPAAPAKPAAPAAPKERRVSAATANRESGNYGTSRTNNPMIDEAMKARMRQREEAQAGASGSSKPEDKSRYVASDGRQYQGPAFGNGSNSSATTPGKKKEDETKTMSIAERMRRRRAGLA